MKHIFEAVHQLRRQFPYFPMAFKMARRAAGPMAVVWMALLVLQGLLPVVAVYLTRTLVDGVAAAVAGAGGASAMLPLLPAGAAMLLVLIVMETCRSVAGWVSAAQAERMRDHVHALIHQQAMRLDFSFFDTPDYYDQLHRARIDAISRPAVLLENAGAFLQNLVTLIAMGGVLLSFGVWIPLLLVSSAMPALVVVVRHTIRFHRWRVDNTMAVRKTSYYDMLLTQREMAAEMRLFGLGPHFRALFAKSRERLRLEQIKLARNEAVAQAAATGIGLAGMAGAMVWLVFHAARGMVSLGGIALFYQAFFHGQRMMRSLLGNAGDIYRNVMFLENLFEFLALRPRVNAPDVSAPMPALQKELTFQNVNFRYQGMDRPALDCFNLRIPAGKITALVGENGAGKTTLVKLICRFYDPDDGCLIMDGTDIRMLDTAALRRRIAVLFQEPVRYHDTAFNNIAFGDFAGAPDMARVEAAARAAGADAPVGRLPNGYETVLGKWFGGAELSAGEWQRLALARAFLGNADLIVLDEPTSNMDSWAESDWLLRFRALAAGRTAIIITHRFTTALHADVIHVMERGRIIESGSHEELLSLRGRYALSWTRQTGAGQRSA